MRLGKGCGAFLDDRVTAKGPPQGRAKLCMAVIDYTTGVCQEIISANVVVRNHQDHHQIDRLEQIREELT
jgi:hypothetical protein